MNTVVVQSTVRFQTHTEKNAADSIKFCLMFLLEAAIPNVFQRNFKQSYYHYLLEGIWKWYKWMKDIASAKTLHRIILQKLNSLLTSSPHQIPAQAMLRG